MQHSCHTLNRPCLKKVTTQIPAILSVLFATILLALCQPAHAQEKCALFIKVAEDQYKNGNLDKATRLIRGCLEKKQLVASERMEAYMLLAKIYISEDKTAFAESAVLEILKIEPDLELTVDDVPPPLLVMFDRMKVEVAAEQKKAAELKPVQPAVINNTEDPSEQKSRKVLWLSVAGGATVIAAVALLGSGSGDSDGPQPPANGRFPAPPGR